MIAKSYLVYVADNQGALFFVELRPEAKVWLRPGATMEYVAEVWEAWTVLSSHEQQPDRTAG